MGIKGYENNSSDFYQTIDIQYVQNEALFSQSSFADVFIH